MTPLSPRNRNLIVLFAALVIGALAAFAAQRFLRGKVEEIESRDKNQATVRLVVAKTNLEKGARLGSHNLAVRTVPREWAHSGAITPEQFERANGALLAYPADAGEPVLWAQLEGQRAPSFSTRLPAGRRALTVPVDEVSSVSGMVEPGDRIDLVVSVRKQGRTYTFHLLQDIEVLATGHQTSVKRTDAGDKEETFTTITLETTPEDAKRVIAAREVGKVTALLRAPGDRSRVSGARSETQGLLGLADPVSSRVPVIYGGGPIGETKRLGEGAEGAPGPGGGL